MTFEWDEAKNRANQKKHCISFEEAQTVFFIPLTKVAVDPDHSEDEDRFLAVGYSELERPLIVVHCFRKSDEVIRINSARKLARSEIKEFEEGL